MWVLVGDGEFVVVEVGVGVLMAVGVGVGVTGIGVGVGAIGVGAGVGLPCLFGIGAGLTSVGSGVGGTSVGVCFIGIIIAFTRVDESIGTRIRFVTAFTPPVDAVAAKAGVLVISANALISEHTNSVMESTPMIILLGVRLAQMILPERRTLRELSTRLFFIFAFLGWLSTTTEITLCL